MPYWHRTAPPFARFLAESPVTFSLPGPQTAHSLQTEPGEGRLKGRAWARALGLASTSHVLSWADQAVVSAASFLALIMIGRSTDASQLGAYALGASILGVLLAAQESLITRPYAIQLHQPRGTPAEHAFSSLVLSVLLSGFCAALLGAVALSLLALGRERVVVEIVLALAATAPFVLTREFARRFAFARLEVLGALLLDLVVAALTVLALGFLSWTGRLSAASAFVAVGLSCGIGTTGWLCFSRAGFAFRFGQLRTTLKQSWSLGRWLLSGQLAVQAQGYVTYWMSLALAGATATGIYAACMSIVSFANPLLFGFYNILTPRSVRAWRAQGASGLRRQAARDSALLAAAMSVFCVLVFWFGETVVQWLFANPDYRGNGHTLNVLALAALAAAVGVPAAIALASAERARAVAVVMTSAAVLNVILVWLLMTKWGLLGAAYGILMAEVAGSLGRWIAFLGLVRNHRA